MPPTFLLAELYARGSRARLAHSALPQAPVHPHVEPRHRLRRLAALGIRG